MKISLLPLVIGFILDLILGDPRGIPHPVVLIGRLISFLEDKLRKIFPKTSRGELAAGALLWMITVGISTGTSWGILYLCGRLNRWLEVFAESVMCWQILAIRDLKAESMKVYDALHSGDTEAARKAVSMIVGRDTEQLDEAGITRAAVETVAENTADGIIAPMVFLVLGGAPAGFFYKAVNTMDSMLGYIDPPYTYFGRVPAKMDDICNFLPARLCALLMLPAGALLHLDVRNGWKIFRRDRCKHASPNSAQTESVCAGLLRVRLAGNALYHGVLHKKQYIGDPLREIEAEDIPRVCRLMMVVSILMLVLCCGIRLMV